MTTTHNTIIGSWVIVLIGNRQYVGTVVDSNGSIPKRIRIQRGNLQGKVVMPSEYEFKNFIPDNEVDD